MPKKGRPRSNPDGRRYRLRKEEQALVRAKFQPMLEEEGSFEVSGFWCGFMYSGSAGQHPSENSGYVHVRLYPDQPPSTPDIKHPDSISFIISQEGRILGGTFYYTGRQTLHLSATQVERFLEFLNSMQIMNEPPHDVARAQRGFGFSLFNRGLSQ